jgi:amino acid adenylation domain-containing protein/non-ribosomal peptide synthase protein (TIGR01720 family)
MLAVMKAGGASVLLETTLPHDRLRTIVQNVDSIVVLSSSSSRELADCLTTGPVMVVDEITITELPGTCITLPEVQPWNKLYVIFTSGSTGTPKGTVITHSNICSATHHQLVISGFSKSSRVYDFAKYSFDVAWLNFFFSLVSGGCLCIPSQEEALNDITGSVLAYNANCLNITPSVGSMLRPSDFSGTLEVVLFAGEALNSSLAVQWAEHFRVINWYGPAECTASTVAEIDRSAGADSLTASLGRGAGLCTWIVDPSCHDTLVPVGDIGELILEGPLVGGGYIGDPEKTAAVFIKDPKWLVAGAPGHEGRRGRVYKTGDLVRYEEDGSLTFISRKDSQVKINGQRVELGDIEHHVRTHVADATDVQVVAQLVTPRDSRKPLLVAFVQITTAKARESNEGLESELKRVIFDINDRLAFNVPAYMIPSAYVPLAALPTTASGKVDRRKLEKMAENLSTQELMDRGSPVLEKREPTTLVEFSLRELWSSVLGLAVGAIGAGDSFLRLGGDSMAAMKLVAAARRQGLSLSVADVFKQPVLCDMAGAVRELSEADIIIKPFALLKGHLEAESVQRLTSDACGVDVSEILDVFPCTPLQEGLLALTAKHPGDYVSRHVFRLQPTADMDRLRSSWDHVIAINPILRTRIVDLNQQGLVQVVVNQPATWVCTEGIVSLAEYRKADKKLTTGLGTPLSRFALFEESVDDETKRFFVWTIHHALYDGWSKPLLLSQLADAYAGKPLSSLPPFQDFVRHISEVQKDEAEKFWSAQFEEFEAQNFPLLPSPNYESRSDTLYTYSISGLQWCKDLGVTASVTLRAAWSVIMSSYTNANDTIFGATVSGRQAPVRGVEQMTGPTIATVPVRITLDKSKTVEELLLQVQAQVIDMTPFEQTGLQLIRRVSAYSERACDFQTLLVIQPAADKEKGIHDGIFTNDSLSLGEIDDGMEEFRTFPLSLECHLQDQGVAVSTRFDSAVLNEEQISILMRQLEHVIRQFCDPRFAKMKLENVALVGQQDLDQIWSWNSMVPETADNVVHDLIAAVTSQQPESQAVCAWDGDWTYRELDELSTNLAYHLVDLGVGPEVIVPLCIEKSKWMPVAMMAVIKAGGASVALDYAQPEDRLRSIVEQVSPIVILTSVANQDLARRLAYQRSAVVMGEQQTTNLTREASIATRTLPAVQPFNKLYVVFTSGSTGAPKGVVVTHANITSAIKHQREALGFTKHSRVFDFASYMFDVVWCDLLQGLSAGGCICIPSNDDRRNDPLGAFARLAANTVIFTPSAIRGLDLRPLKGLRHVHFIGEALSTDDCSGLQPDVLVTNLYGPTECTTFSTARLLTRASGERIGIGAGLGLRTWLVQPFDHSKLVPMGCIGELLLEGPLVAAGYLGDEVKTAAAFINDPPWLLEGTFGHAGRRGRVYKTGDLARYNADGTLLFLGRKDSQVKINGQRVELGDIEHHVQSNILHSQDLNVVADVVKPLGSNNTMLIAFIEVPGASTSGDEETMQEKLEILTAGLSGRLLSQVPAYMVPSAYIPIGKIPVTPTGKIDRRKLRSIGQQLSFEDLTRANSSSSSKQRKPSTAAEKSLQILWATVLGLDAEKISADDSFLRIGGDSIAAMRFVSAARKQNIAVSVADIFKHPVLCNLATIIEGTNGVGHSHGDWQIEPFALLHPQENLETLKEQIGNRCNVGATEVADAFPCTPLQEGLLALSAKRTGDYVARFVYPLLAKADVEQFCKAWDAVVSVTPILRTRIIDLGERGLVQAVINQPTKWPYRDETISLDAYQKVDRQLNTGLGTPLSRVAVIRDPDSGNRFFVWTIHHALYDGWSIPLMLEKLEAAYNWNNSDVVPPSPSFQSFVKHVINMDQSVAASYWAEQFHGSEAQIFPLLSSATYQPMSNAFIKHRIRDLQWPKTDVTPSMFVRAAWSLLATQYTDSTDTVFGVTVSGRQAAVPGIDRMIGPTIATVPVRVTINPEEMTVEELLHQIQTQAVEMTAFEQSGLQRIRRISPEAQRGCEFQTLLVVHPAEEEEKASHWFMSRRDENGEDDTNVTEHDTYALTIECGLEQQGLRLRIAYDANILTVEQIERLAYQLEHIVRQVCSPENASKSLDCIEMISSQDMQDLWEWNGTCPEAVESCLHDMISETAKMYPDAPAINGWDGDFTYDEFDDLSTRLAQHLVGAGIGPDTVVPLYFEKSRWSPVAMLAVMKAGGASVMMDSRQPRDRLRAIIDQINPTVIIASVSNEELTRQLTNAPIVLVSDKLLEQPSDLEPTQMLPRVQPWNKAYLIFTSGSTGVPKGAMMTHANVCSAVRYQSLAHGYTPDARVYDFTSYAFDTVWNNFMHTFTIGACLCIPSESERRDDLAGSIERFKPTILDITPSAATALQSSTIKSLRTLILGGERLLLEYAKRWAPLVDLKLPYGPCECTPTATIATIEPNISKEPSIGRGTGLLTWIVDAENGNRLLPIGATGELVLEGPLVGLGYLGDEEKTMAAFTQNPPWLLRGGAGKPGREGRLYKTGDLVRYNPDGTIMFVDRKDAQVKINGQRLELGEVESHMLRHPLTRQSLSLYPRSGPCAKKLVGIFSLGGMHKAESVPRLELIGMEYDVQVQEHIRTLQILLGEALPTYMVPSVWVALRDIPLNPSGKLNRRLVEDWLLRMDPEIFARINNRGDIAPAREPQTGSERIVRDACSVILNTPPAEVNLESSFVANGGDSISAMRLAPYCRAANLIVSVAMILKCKSLADVAVQSSLASNTSTISYAEDFGKPFTLSPIQKWFFDQSSLEMIHKNNNYYCNQGFYVKVNRHVWDEEVSAAISQIVEQHSMLRARFERSESGWMQSIPPPAEAVFHFGSADALSLDEIKANASKSHQSLDIQRGLVFAADLYTLPCGAQYLIFVAHHLVVDLVSWRIILDDLEALLNGKKLLDGLPFQLWNRLQIKEAQSSRFEPEKVLSTQNVHNNFEFWNFTEHTSNTTKDHAEKKFEIGKATTSLLLKEANAAFNTEPVDLILSAVWDAFFKAFPMREGLTMFNEGHGREAWTSEIDLSRTVGWFTTMSPIHIARNAGDSGANIVRLVKDSRKRLPSNGWAYWVSRYLNDRGMKAFESHASTMEVQFNFHGQFQQLERSDSLFDVVNFDDSVSAVGPSLPTSVLFDINVVIEAGVTKISFAWNRHLTHQDLIQEWIAQISTSLQSICVELTNKTPERTLCDYEFLDISYKEIDELHTKILSSIEQLNDAQVEAIYPSSPMVDGILLSQMKGTGSYETSQTWEIRPQGTHNINIHALVGAWQVVVARHPSLRTVFMQGIDGSVAFNSVLLKSCRPNIVLVESDGFESAISLLKELPKAIYTPAKPAHRLVLCKIIGDNRVLCQIEMSHAISDGASTAITMQDWAKAYSGELNIEELRETSHDFALALTSVSKADKMAYWKKKLFALEPCHFPHLAKAALLPEDGNATGTVTLELTGDKFKLMQQFCEAQSITPASLFHATWALTLSAYTSSNSVCFAYLASGRDLPVRGLIDAIGAFANVMICRADISEEWSGKELINHLHDQVLEDLSFQHCSIADVQHELGLPFGQALFNTIMSFQKDDELTEGMETQDLVFVDLDWEDPTEYDITINVRHTSTSACFTLDHRLVCLSNEQALRLVSLLETVVNSLVSDDKLDSTAGSPIPSQLSTMDSVGEKDLQDIWKWNERVPESADGLVHDIIADIARRTPDAAAICAWDGDFTYAELDALATKLAHHLVVSMGVETKDVVPLCFEKSKWMPVAVLAVMKAGAASVALDTTLPAERLRSIIRQVDPKIILTSVAKENMAKRLIENVAVPISDVHLANLDPNLGPLPEVEPSNKLYIVFTSGSTGVPKGVIITHSNFSSAICHQQVALGFKSTSRVYDFAKYAFDVMWSNLLHTLTAGACLCIPSEAEASNDITRSLVSYKANFADLTPSVASTLRPTDLTTLEHVLFSGEVLTTHLAAQWAEQATVLNTYGPAECSVKATFAVVGKADTSASSIGTGFGMCTWIVQPTNHNKLVPIGCVGELLLEGSLVGAGYLRDPEKTEAAFIEDPIWLVHGPGLAGRRGRLYKTGDLVRYNADGSMTFVGRKDAQVKINGQRLELGDVEHHVRTNVVHNAEVQVFAEVIKPLDSSKSILVAFIYAGGESVGQHTENVSDITAGLNERLETQIPAYMIPSAYVLLDELPMTATGKTDRRYIRKIGQGLTFEEVMALNSRSRDYKPPSTPSEKLMQRLWASVLGIKLDIISADDSFLRIGGDSIGAMKLVGAARVEGLALTVTDIFQQPRLSDMANAVGQVSSADDEIIEPFSLLNVSVDHKKARDQAAKLCQIDATQIEDIFPCTPLQEGLLALTAKKAGDFVAQYVLPLQETVDLVRFQEAWARVLQMTPILRTRIVDLEGQGLVQVVINESANWPQCSTVVEWQEREGKLNMGMGDPLVHYAITGITDDKQPFFMWNVHHALYDGWSMPRIMDRLELAYEENAPLGEAPPFQRFVKHVISIDEESSKQYWQAQFEGSEAQAFPALPSPMYQPTSNSSVTHSIDDLHWPTTEITASTAIRTAWAILTARHTNSSDVVFGVTVSGRQAAVHEVDEMTGPTLATVPVRVAFDWEQPVQRLLRQVQKQMVEMTAFEQTGLQKIYQMEVRARQACEFQTLMLIHPAQEARQHKSQLFAIKHQNNGEDEEVPFAEFDTHAITIECDLKDRGVKMRFEFDESIISQSKIQKLAGQMENVLKQLCDAEQGRRLIADVETVSKADLDDIWRWNATVPETVQTPVHEIITAVCQKRPNAPAICAWDGDWSYRQLDDLSSRLAHYLVRLGIGPEVVVPLCFEKSKWTPIAVLGVIKAGGVCVTVDSNLPEDRIASIVQQVEPMLILASHSNKDLATHLSAGKLVVVVEEKLLDSLPMPELQLLPTVQPSSTVYINFTSGSTGTPKGVRILHSNFSSAMRHQHGAHNFEAGARVYDFASYAFDTSWQNLFATLECGACLCIPSEDERRDDLAGSFERFGITHSEITPSAALVLPLSTIKKLDTLILGGEKFPEEQAKKWAPFVKLKNSYGPCECTPTSTVADIDPANFNGASIGTGRGVNTWVVDTVTGNSLVPVGGVGELLLEGPLVGPGYLNDPEKTASVFIKNPSWLSRGAPGYAGREGRLYKTGDLVYYNEDGSLIYIGRKDAQVKIHGQRVELGDIENHILRHDLTRQSACLLPKSGPFTKMLVGIFSIKKVQDVVDGTRESSAQPTPNLTRSPSPRSSETGSTMAYNTIEDLRLEKSKPSTNIILEDSTTAIRSHIADMQNLLESSLPSYMVPTVWIALKDIPLNPSGKLNRKQVEAWLTSLDQETHAKIASIDSSPTCREPETEPERILRDACSMVLNVPVTEINLQRSFVANGGDSISAMRLSPHCRAANLVFSVATLLRTKSLAEVAKISSVEAISTISRTEEFDKPFALSPIQQWFFDQSPRHLVNTPDYYCNQSFYVRINQAVSVKDVRDAVAKVVEHHSMLRARFQQQDNGWYQCIPKPSEATYHFEALKLESLSEIRCLAARRQQELDFENGLVFSADLCELTTSGQYLILIAHHLVIDLVSWRLILDDLESLLTGGSLMESLPFQVWNGLQLQEAKSARLNPERVLSTHGIRNDLAFWNFTSEIPNTTYDHTEKLVVINRETTLLILKEANKAFDTEPVDLLLSAVCDAFFWTFPSRDGLTIFNEGHGREPWKSEIDLARTVGWFTTMSPIHVSRSGSSTNIPRLVKDARKKLPSNGWAYFASRYLNNKGLEAFRSHNSVMEMTFNYHGQFQQLEREDAFFESITLDNVSDNGPCLPASSLFNVNMSVEGGETHVSFAWNRHISRQVLIHQWVDRIEPSLQSICRSLASRAAERTLCDYEFLTLDYTSLDDLHSHIIPEIESLNNTEIEDIYPCSPMVDGMLLSQLKGAGFYETSQFYEIKPRGSHNISMKQLSAAWQDVVSRHPPLRSVFIQSPDSTVAFNQVVLRHHHGEVILLESNDQESAQALLKSLPKVDYQQLKPPHRLALCQVSATKSIICQIEMNHTITDGESTGILLGDWAKAYEGALGRDDFIETSRGFARFLRSGIAENKKSYWKKKLAGLQPCNFPHLDKISAPTDVMSWSTVDIDGKAFSSMQRFCESHSITPASLFHAAWALTLVSYTGTDSVCFGYLASGRDLPIPGVREAIGAYANMMVCRADVSREWSKSRFVQYLHRQVLEDMEYQHCSLADIQHDLNLASGQQLFNTIVSFQRDFDDSVDEPMSQKLEFIDADGDDPTEYDVSISITFGAKRASLFINCPPSRFSNQQAHRIISLFETTVTALTKEDLQQSNENTLGSLAMTSDEDLEDIWQWNSVVPKTMDTCLHDLISATAQRQPKAYAVNAWDGDWTYGELDGISTRLALHLKVVHGVAPNATIALYFGKSRWTSIAMLAVMKAGGAFVHLDTSQPEDWQRSVMEQSQPMLLLSSALNEQQAAKLTDRTPLVIDEDILNTLPATSDKTLPSAGPGNKACLVFTSDSAGTPEGTILTHANLSSAVEYQQGVLGYKPDSKVYDCSNPSFKISWINFMHTLTVGGCLCVPSEVEQMDNFVASINHWKPTILSTTPSEAARLQGNAVQSLQTLILGGERVSQEQAKYWAPLLDLRIVYGPYECTSTATVAAIGMEVYEGPTIGRGVGLNTWITDTQDGTTLVPIGSTGELVLEGPLVAAGYLHNVEKAGFVENPPWLTCGSRSSNHPGRTGRVFKTGDLARYNRNGTLTFMGRKDAQVKMHGQHVELVEIESHMMRSNSIRQGACFIPISGRYANKLVGVFSLAGTSEVGSTVLELISGGKAQEVQEAIQALQAVLDNSMPAYLVPSVWVGLKTIPIDGSGNLQRASVEDWLSNIDAETHARISNATSSVSGAATTAERVIREACSIILNIPISQINLQRSFIANGGDSISAMRVSPYCRAAGVVLSVASLLRSKRLIDVAESATITDGPALFLKEDFEKPFPLSPIQQWFFDQCPAKKVNTFSYYYNQAFYVQITRQVLPEEVSVAIRKIVHQHSMLRARFQMDETTKTWSQLVSKPNDALYHFESLHVDSLVIAESIVSQRHEELDIERGLVLVVDMFTLPSAEQYLSLIAHHLVVDLVSWRTILDDLEALLNGGTLLDELPFQVWNSLQIEEAQSSKMTPERVLSTEICNELDFWNYTLATPNTYGDHIEESFEIDRATTAILLKEANKAFNTEPVDLILASVWDAFFQTFKLRDGLTIFNEGHGREAWSPDIDLSRTVGWFTTMAPMHVPRHSGSETDYIARVVKDIRKQLPSNGWAYFASRYFNEKGKTAFASHDCVMEVLFNYHGQFQQFESEDNLFENITFNNVFDVGSDVPVSALFSINVSIEAGLTKFTFSWNRFINHQNLIRKWIAQINPSMRALCSSLSAREPSPTIADYEFLSLDYKGLEELQYSIIPAIQSKTGTTIMDIYPCSPMVDGMLLSQIRDPGAYKTSLTYEVRHRDSQQALHVSQLAKAWQSVIARHPALRSVFIEGIDKTTAFSQVVLENYQGEIVILEAQTKAAGVKLIQKLPALVYRQFSPAHRLVLCGVEKDKTVICHIEMSHAIVDGASTINMLEDWSKAYAGILGDETLLETARNFARTLKASLVADKMTYWKNKLANMEPCSFPRLSEVSQPGDGISMVCANIDGDTFIQIRNFCESQSVTPASLFQSAWALTLAAYTGNDSVCFGYIASGRDLPIAGIGDVIGAYANILVCRADISRSWTPQQFVQHIHNQVLEDLNFQHYSLADIQHDLQVSAGGSLFNTTVSFQKDDADAEDVEVQDLVFIDVDHEDPTEVSPPS